MRFKGLTHQIAGSIIKVSSNTRHWSNNVLMIARRLRRRPNNKTTLGQSIVSAVVTSFLITMSTNVPQNTHERTLYSSVCLCTCTYYIISSFYPSTQFTSVIHSGYFSYVHNATNFGVFVGKVELVRHSSSQTILTHIFCRNLLSRFGSLDKLHYYSETPRHL